MDAAQARQLKIKTGALVRTMKDHTSYKNESDGLNARIEEARAAQAALPEEERDPGVVNRLEAQLAETVAVLPTIVVKVETWLGELENIMGTIEEACSANMEEVRENDEWKKAEQAVADARAFQEQ